MKSKAAVLWPDATTWSIEEIDLDPPKPGEVLVRICGAGLCHSDAHLLEGGYAGLRRPIIGGHEGAGVVEAVGPGTTLVRPGDHVVFSFMPSCGWCHSCVRGLQHLCERGAHIPQGFQISDLTARHHARGEDLSTFCFIGTFAAHTVVNEGSCVPVDASLPLDRLCLLGCAGVTGWGAAVNSGAVRPGDTTVVVGIGGIGAFALQGAKFAGAQEIIAVDPVPFKRVAAQRLGATHACENFENAHSFVSDVTRGRMANQVIMSMGVGDGAFLGDALALVGKQGRVVIVNVHPAEETTATVSLRDVQSMEKHIVGCLGGSWPPRRGIVQLADLYGRGLLPLDEIVTARYTLDRLKDGYADQAAGQNLRGVLTSFD